MAENELGGERRSISDALAVCLEHAKQGQPYGARPVGFKGVVYAWQSQDGSYWELHQTDAGVEEHDDTIILGQFEVLPSDKIKSEWPV